MKLNKLPINPKHIYLITPKNTVIKQQRRDNVQYDIINLLLFFLIYGFLGFVLETTFRSIVEKKVVISRGFLTGFFCPLYGISALAIIQIFTLSEVMIDGRLTALITATIGSIASVTFMEYVTGRTLDRIFHHKMWDYSELPFNLHSYICLDFSLAWGIVALILANMLHPLMEVAVYSIAYPIRSASVYFILSALIVDGSYNMRKTYHLDTLKL
jgi:uncharacterized membrane protein